MVEMEDVPADIWNRTHIKWSAALERGWTTDLWYGCSLCEWIKANRLDCRGCPLYPDGWCRYNNYESRLYRYFYSYGAAGGDDWKRGVKTFLAYIKPYCTEANDESLDLIESHCEYNNQDVIR